jgi:hypothetical protein
MQINFISKSNLWKKTKNSITEFDNEIKQLQLQFEKRDARLEDIEKN